MMILFYMYINSVVRKSYFQETSFFLINLFPCDQCMIFNTQIRIIMLNIIISFLNV